ncbi:MAG: retropepsin-like aspartic protease, partial [Pseudomonadota bacterium]
SWRYPSIPLQRQTSGALTLDAGIGNQPVTVALLLDTGSSFVVLSERMASQIGEAVSEQPVQHVRGATADGKSVVAPVHLLSALHLGQVCTLRNVEVVVLPGADRAIIGLSALRRLGTLGIDFQTPSLRFSACDNVTQLQ